MSSQLNINEFLKYKSKGIFFTYKNGRIEINFDNSIGLKTFYLDERKYFYLKKHITKKQPLISAIITKRFRPNIVLDLTAGFGFDAIQLAIYGISVICIEKNFAIFSMLKEYIGRIGLVDMEVATRIRPIFGDAKEILHEVGTKIPYPDVVYLDPFFSGYEMRRTKEKKYMQVIKLLAEDKDNNLDELFEGACEITNSRVVIKRAPNADVVCTKKARLEYQIKGRGHRFDVYIKK